ncbi:MAG: hypothetical protein K2H76_04550 [Muribaculaceae bacterium]|nr:hypothetical protein [Muribaculaceae bacterium]
MKKLLMMALMAVCSLVLSFSANAQQLPKSELATFVAEINKTLPQRIDQDMVFSKVQLLNDGNQIDFVINMNPTEVTSDEFISACKTMTKQEIRDYFGPEFKQMVEMLPVPVSIFFVFKDGKTYRVMY